MFRAHFVVTQAEPAMDRLNALSEGYQLWRESRTGLHFLTTYSEPLGRRPDFSNFLEREKSCKADLSQLDAFVADPTSPVNVRKFEVSSDLIHQTATLSKQLDMLVLCCETTDDEYAMAVGADRGALTYLRFRTERRDFDPEDGIVEVSFTPGAGFAVNSPGNAFCGVAETAIREMFALDPPNLYNFTDIKPTREQASQLIKGRGASLSAYLDSFGVFNRLSHAEPKLDLKTRLLIPFRYLGSALIMPFLLAGISGLAMVDSKRLRVDDNIALWRVMLAGALVLAIPIALLAMIILAVLG